MHEFRKVSDRVQRMRERYRATYPRVCVDPPCGTQGFQQLGPPVNTTEGGGVLVELSDEPRALRPDQEDRHKHVSPGAVLTHHGVSPSEGSHTTA